MRTLAGWTAAIVVAAAPAVAFARDGHYDPCKNRGERRLAVVYARSGGLLAGDGGCKGTVFPEKKTVCAGDTITWSVVNTCDGEEVSSVRIDGLDRVAEKCTVISHLPVNAVREIRCRLIRKIPEDIKQEYMLSGRIGKSRFVVDPELDIRRPQ